uniref:Uncharacterized protein n=1 Tax=Anopheles epiroticus TaxID=199890 RepID=A0A182P1Z4_9DIPT
MDKYLRRFIKYQTYMIVIVTLEMVLLLTPAIADFEVNHFENLRFGGKVAIIFGVIWFFAVMSLIKAIHCEDKRFIYPYAFVFGLDLSLQVLREIYLIMLEGLDGLIVIKLLVAVLVVPYVFASLFALHRLFTVDPVGNHRSEGFVRFDRNELTVVEEGQISSTSGPANPSAPPVV